VAEKFDPTHADRLENPQRLVELPPENVVALLDLRGAETVVDYGAGTGLYTVPIAKALSSGRVIAVDEHAEFLAYIDAKLTAAGLSPDRVTKVPTTENRVPLADGAADRVFLLNVLHHIWDEPVAMGEIVRLLAPGGRLVVVDFAQMERPVGPPNDHVLSLEQARASVAGMGLRELSVHEPGVVGRYQIAIVAEKPSGGDVAA
jgi:ubiquinone/menaquinone biosynthesis C-methylase UbiE